MIDDRCGKTLLVVHWEYASGSHKGARFYSVHDPERDGRIEDWQIKLDCAPLGAASVMLFDGEGFELLQPVIDATRRARLTRGRRDMTGLVLTTRQRAALKWLFDRGGDGVFDKTGVMLAMGEREGLEINGREGFMRATWNALRDLGLLEYYEPSTRSKMKRARLTDAGRAEAERAP